MLTFIENNWKEILLAWCIIAALGGGLFSVLRTDDKRNSGEKDLD